MKIRKELWFGFILMGLILLGVAIMPAARRHDHQRPPRPADARR